MSQLAFHLFDLLGTAAFAISGAMVACKKKADLFGVLFLAVITSMGGGMTRDLMLGINPPALFSNRTDLTVTVVMALIVFLLVRYFSDFYYKEEATVEYINNFIDAIGLGMFAVTGCQICIDEGYGTNWFLVNCMAMTTACGGGLLRDIILNEIPFILTKHIYAVAAIAGSVTYCTLYYTDHGETVAMSMGICVTFVLRWLSTKYHWNLPGPVRGGHRHPTE